MEYWKINSLWKRDKDTNKIIEGSYACPEFEALNRWRCFEKIDGTNIRIEWNWERKELSEGIFMTGELNLQFKGRTDAAMIPPHLLKYLQETFTKEKMAAIFPPDKAMHGILFGEGYGQKIQSCGGLYADGVGFVLFDIVVGQWVLQADDAINIAKSLDIPFVPDLGIKTTQEVVDVVKSNPMSLLSKYPQVMEGVVCIPEPLMLFRNRTPIKMKLKCKDYRCLNT